MWNIGAAAVYALLCLRVCRIYFHAVQQSGYRVLQRAYVRVVGRMGFWLTVALTMTGAVCGTVSLFDPWLGFGLSAAGCVLSLFCERRTSDKTPLVCTDRIKRTAVLLYAVLFAVCSVVGRYAAFVPMFLPFAVWVAFVLMLPIESLIRERFLRRCKARLALYGTKVIGVTGSAGKTSVKNILAEMLAKKYRVLATPESYNTPLGVAKTVNELLASETEYLIVEMGARQSGDILELCELTEPIAGIVTAICEQHMETFGSIESVVNTKFELPEYLCGKGFCVLNGDDAHIRARLREQVPCGNVFRENGAESIVRSEGSEQCAEHRSEECIGIENESRENGSEECVGIENESKGNEAGEPESGCCCGEALCSLYAVGSLTPRADFGLKEACCDAEGSLLTLEILGREYRVRTALLGRHQWNNILVAAYTALLLGVSSQDVVAAIGELKPVSHRLEVVARGKITVIDDSYNANPKGARYALECLSLFEGRKIVVTPGLVEEGVSASRLNRELGREVAKVCEIAFFVGRNAVSLCEGAETYESGRCSVYSVANLKEASEALSERIRCGDVVLFENDLPDCYERA